MNPKDYKTIMFYKLAESIGAIKLNDIKDISIKDLILDSFLFLNKSIIVTRKQKKDYEVFKDSYNRYIDYCLESKLTDKNKNYKITTLKVTTIPDMSHIKIPDISKELKDKNIDLDKLSAMFSKLKK